MWNPSPPFKILRNNHGEAVRSVQGDPASTGANTKRKRAQKPLSLLDLNIECLRDVFNLKRVSVLDLGMLSQTCTKLHEIATDIFARSHTICNFTSLALVDAVLVDRVLHNFGSSILDIRIDLTPYAFDAVQIIDSILDNCNNLQSIQLEGYAIPDCGKIIAKIRLLFGKLNTLRIKNVSIEGWKEWPNLDNCYSYNRTVTPKGNVVNIFGDCHSLVKLEIINCCVLEKVIFESNFSKLLHMQYQADSKHMEEGVSGFVFRHSNLKTLILAANIKIAGTIEIISANCTELERLEIRVDDSPKAKSGTVLIPLEKLKHLEELKIKWYGQNILGLMKELRRSTSLKVLELESTLCCPKFVPALGKLKSVRVLKLSFINDLQNLRALKDLTQLTELYVENLNLTDFNFDLVLIIERLVNLKKFKFDISGQRVYSLSKDTYVQLVKVVEKRPVQNRYLEIYCRATGDFEDSLRPSVAVKELK